MALTVRQEPLNVLYRVSDDVTQGRRGYIQTLGKLCDLPRPRHCRFDIVWSLDDFSDARPELAGAAESSATQLQFELAWSIAGHLFDGAGYEHADVNVLGRVAREEEPQLALDVSNGRWRKGGLKRADEHLILGRGNQRLGCGDLFGQSL